MGLAASVASFVAIFLLMVGLTLWLRVRGVMSQAHAPVISGLITECVLPAMIFGYVARAPEQPALKLRESSRWRNCSPARCPRCLAALF